MTIDTTNQALVKEKVLQFEHTQTHGPAIIRFLEREHVLLVRAIPLLSTTQRGAPEVHPRKWELVGVLPKHVSEPFQIQGDILIHYADFTKLEPRALTEMQTRLRDDPRFDKEFCMLFSPDPNSVSLAAKCAGETAILVVSPNDLASDKRDLRTRISTLLLSIDHFNITTPIRNPSAFFGRQAAIRDIRMTLESGAHVGIFGLRKAGKSSALLQVEQNLAANNWSIIHIDLGTYLADPSTLVSKIAQEVKTATAKFSRHISKKQNKRPPPKWTEDFLSGFEAAPTSYKFLIAIDELDLALPGRTFEPDAKSIALLRILAQLRSMTQQLQATNKPFPRFLCAGIDSSIFEDSTILGKPNPLFHFAGIRFLEPLDRDELARMIRTLGKKTSLHFRDHQLIDQLHREFGGHPLLTRQACSFIHRHRPPGEVPHTVTAKEVQFALEATGPNTPSKHANEILTEFEDLYPDEAVNLRACLAANSAPSFRAMPHAASYGLITEDSQLRIQALARKR